VAPKSGEKVVREVARSIALALTPPLSQREREEERGKAGTVSVFDWAWNSTEVVCGSWWGSVDYHHSSKAEQSLFS
jgi:hypothetical protein